MIPLALLRRPLTLVRRLVARDQLAMSTTSGFFRNMPQLLELTSLVPEPGRIYVFGCSTGCEAYSVRMAYAMWKPSARFELVGFDVDPHVLSIARRAEYRRAQIDYYGGDEVSRGPAQRFFVHRGSTKSWRVVDAIRSGCRFERGSVLDDEAALPAADVVLCQNVLVHMGEDENRRALRNLRRATKPGGFLVIGGMAPQLRARLTRELELIPVSDGVRQIHDGWRELRRIWDTTPARVRPYFALEPFAPGPEAEHRYATIFRVGS